MRRVVGPVGRKGREGGDESNVSRVPRTGPTVLRPFHLRAARGPALAGGRVGAGVLAGDVLAWTEGGLSQALCSSPRRHTL